MLSILKSPTSSKLEEHIKSKEEFISPITNLDKLSDV